MKIIPAEVTHAEAISARLVTHFEAINQEFGFEKYKTDYDLMYKHVSQRISEQSEFSYIVLTTDDDQFIGFANTLVTNGVGELLVVDVISEYLDESSLSLLISRAVELLKESNVHTIFTEIPESKPLLRALLIKHGLKVVMQRAILRV
ncbi:MAG: hypothetical protein QY314_01220 [Candidatus Dojkabacteria bacterium]|nr:MAG: hypothetical protein QY314_01220 [Candidatus Dojkabacteria bacterium]